MNFKSHYPQLKTLLKDRSYRHKDGRLKHSYLKGVYVFSKTRGSDYKKVGIAYWEGGMWNRLKYYTICYPHEDEFILDYVITTKTKDAPRALETEIHNDPRLKGLENIKASKEWKAVSFSTKWAKLMRGLTSGLTKDDLYVGDSVPLCSSKKYFNEVLMSVLGANRDKWEYVVAFGEEGVMVKDNTDNSLDELVLAYTRDDLQEINPESVKKFFKDRDRSFITWTKDKGYVYKTGDEIRVEGYGWLQLKKVKKDRLF